VLRVCCLTSLPFLVMEGEPAAPECCEEEEERTVTFVEEAEELHALTAAIESSGGAADSFAFARVTAIVRLPVASLLRGSARRPAGSPLLRACYSACLWLCGERLSAFAGLVSVDQVPGAAPAA